jgi:hypothetical protein
VAPLNLQRTLKVSISPLYRDALLRIADLMCMEGEEREELNRTLNELAANYEGEDQSVRITVHKQ